MEMEPLQKFDVKWDQGRKGDGSVALPVHDPICPANSSAGYVQISASVG